MSRPLSDVTAVKNMVTQLPTVMGGGHTRDVEMSMIMRNVRVIKQTAQIVVEGTLLLEVNVQLGKGRQ